MSSTARWNCRDIASRFPLAATPLVPACGIPQRSITLLWAARHGERRETCANRDQKICARHRPASCEFRTWAAKPLDLPGTLLCAPKDPENDVGAHKKKGRACPKGQVSKKTYRL